MNIGHSNVDALRLRELLERVRRVHFIGIGGIGISALAELLLSRGISVSGSDASSSEITQRLSSLGADIWVPGSVEALARSGAEIAVYSLSIQADDPEYLECVRLGIPTVSRAELLGALMTDYEYRIGVSGSHGKSTVTAMLAAIFSRAGLSPTVVSGAPFATGGSLIRGGRRYLIYEACEYCDSFLHFRPTHAVILNIDLDHTDYFPDLSALSRSFTLAAERAERLALICTDGETALSVADCVSVPKLTLGARGDIRYGIVEHEKGFGAVFADGRELFTGAPGRHNAENAAVAAAVSMELGVPWEIIAEALSEFSGIKRRLERIATLDGVPVIYDYAHHPKEIHAAIDTLEKMRYNKIAVVFRPHTYTRTSAFFDELAAALARCRYAFIAEIYAAREEPIPFVDAAALARRVTELGGSARAIDTDISIAELPSDMDCLVLMGAGDLTKIKKRITEYEKSCDTDYIASDGGSRRVSDSGSG